MKGDTIIAVLNFKQRSNKMKKDKQLDLYSDDFGYSRVWKDVCDSLGVDYNKADKVTIFYDKSKTIINE